MAPVYLLIESCDLVIDPSDLASGRTYQHADFSQVLEMMVGMFESRATSPLELVVFDENHIGFTHETNHGPDLGYKGPYGEWKTRSVWLYIIARDFAATVDYFPLLADLVRLWGTQFPEMCSPDVKAAMEC